MKSDYGAVGVIINNLSKGQIIIHTIERAGRDGDLAVFLSMANPKTYKRSQYI